MGVRDYVLTILVLLAILCSCKEEKKGNVPHTYVFSVGIDDYSRSRVSLSNLSKAKTDARDFCNVMGKHAEKVVCLLGNEATHDNIMTQMYSLFLECEEKDAAIFYFSGHGESDGIYCCDADVTFQELRSVFRMCKAKRKFLFIDACESGGVRGNGDEECKKGVDSTFHADAGVLLFLSSRAKESSQENSADVNSLFTKYLLKGLKGKSDINRDSIISAIELYGYVHGHVVKESENKQHPVMCGRFSKDIAVLDWTNK